MFDLEVFDRSALAINNDDAMFLTGSIQSTKTTVF
jgi:hypothetical protein